MKETIRTVLIAHISDEQPTGEYVTDEILLYLLDPYVKKDPICLTLHDVQIASGIIVAEDDTSYIIIIV